MSHILPPGLKDLNELPYFDAMQFAFGLMAEGTFRRSGGMPLREFHDRMCGQANLHRVRGDAPRAEVFENLSAEIVSDKIRELRARRLA